MTLNERVAWTLQKIKEKQKINNIQLAEILQIDKNTVLAYCHGKGNLKGSALAVIVKTYGINGEWLMSGLGEPFPGANEIFPEICGPPGVTKEQQDQIYFSVRENINRHQTQPDNPSDEFVFVGQVNGKISAGAGLRPDNAVDMRLAFRKEWFKKKGDPGNMSLIKVSGDSMEPTLLSGDLVLIDHSRKTISSQGGLYAISIDHEILIKRLNLNLQDNKILVMSDNKQYATQEIDADKITVNGKVIWFAREIER